jgi:Flp pilus assembly protein TadG
MAARDRSKHNAQSVVEFAIVLPIVLFLLLGIFDLGRAFVFGVSVQNGAREAVRVGANAVVDPSVTDAQVWGRLVAASNPALIGCTSAGGNCGGGNWTFTMLVDTGTATYSSLAAARAQNAALSGAKLTLTANGSVALLPGVNTGGDRLNLPSIDLQGRAAMVIL